MPTATKGRRLTEVQRAMAAEYAARYPDPLAVLLKRRPRQVRVARAWGLDDDEIRSLCWAAICGAATYWRADGGASFGTVAVFMMRSAVYHAVAARGRASRAGERSAVRGDAKLAGGRGRVWDAIPDPATVGRGRPTDPGGHLAAAVRTLDGQGRAVIERRFGLGGGEPQTQQEVAAALGVTRGRISQIEKRAVGRLRDRLRELCGDLYGHLPGGPGDEG